MFSHSQKKARIVKQLAHQIEHNIASLDIQSTGNVKRAVALAVRKFDIHPLRVLFAVSFYFNEQVNLMTSSFKQMHAILNTHEGAAKQQYSLQLTEFGSIRDIEKHLLLLTFINFKTRFLKQARFALPLSLMMSQVKCSPERTAFCFIFNLAMVFVRWEFYLNIRAVKTIVEDLRIITQERSLESFRFNLAVLTVAQSGVLKVCRSLLDCQQRFRGIHIVLSDIEEELSDSESESVLVRPRG